MVLVAGAFLDEMLTQILDAKFTKEGIEKNYPEKDPNRGLYQKLLGGPVALLSSSWAKATVCRVFGIIKQPEYDALDAFGRMRNRFAHSGFEIALADQDVAEFLTIMRDYLASSQSEMAPIDGSNPPLSLWRFALKLRGVIPDEIPSNAHVVMGVAIMLQLSLLVSYSHVMGSDHSIDFAL